MDTQAVQEDAAASSKVLVLATPSALTPTTTTTIAPNDELPYPPEKFPGKVCALCNLGERSQLGQGNMLKILVNDESMEVPERMLIDQTAAGGNDTAPSTANSSFEDSDSAVVLSHKRQKNGNKLK